MQKDYARIVKCPFCGEEKELLSLLSGNGIGSTSWSDGKTVGPMMPRVSPVQKCPRCGKYYLHYKQEGRTGKNMSDELGQLSYSSWKETYEQFREDATIDNQDRCVILINLIHGYNSAYYRFCDDRGIFICEPPIEANPPQEEFEFFVHNIQRYIALAEWTTRQDDLLFKAELYREAGMFEQCKETLNTIDYGQLNEYTRGLYDGIRKRMENKVKKVFRIGEEYLTPAEKQEAEKRQAFWKLHKKSSYKPVEYPGWNVCKHGHCSKHLEYKCRWCGETDFVERLDEDIPVETKKKLYVGVKDGKWVLTEDPHITGQTERIRSITVDCNGKYKIYYHMDGQNPHPFHSNTIHLNDETTIKGGYLVKMCDIILNGKIHEIRLTTDD